MVVRGYDISLHASHVEYALIEHFSQCGRVLSACAPPADIEECEGVLDSIATVTLLGQAAVEKALQLCGCAAVEKALQLCGCDVKGLGFFQVTRVVPPIKNMLPFMAPPGMWTSPRTDGSLMIRHPDMYMNLIPDPVFLVTKENLSLIRSCFVLFLGGQGSVEERTAASCLLLLSACQIMEKKR
ncbi:PREDICTED: uncharacterized protein LOC104745532 [Camelina sativa]|uniref:Uncharacterized protein LOC104745532 n=1 Tax=Camelina sativa TaxID=90675 RepID=A0ABM1QZM8_CAMSA|nr:PREDICTED: uncharacterized protein LOC104745532 [Camelina sativa]